MVIINCKINYEYLDNYNNNYDCGSETVGCMDSHAPR